MSGYTVLRRDLDEEGSLELFKKNIQGMTDDEIVHAIHTLQEMDGDDEILVRQNVSDILATITDIVNLMKEEQISRLFFSKSEA